MIKYCYLWVFLLVLKIFAEDYDVRISQGHYLRGDSVRISIIANRTVASDVFTYQGNFKHRWTEKFLNTGIMKTTLGATNSFTVENKVYSFYIPSQTQGVVGLIFADPCLGDGKWVPCSNGQFFQTATRTPALVNAINSHNDTHYWMLLGDNFYDQDGSLTDEFFDELTMESKLKLTISVPGNHDYFVCGDPACYNATYDQMANGFYQYYGMDSESGLTAETFPYDFSVNPDNDASASIDERLLRPNPMNFFIAQRIGNVGVIGYTGAGSWNETKDSFKAACSSSTINTADVILIVSHWDTPGGGVEFGMEIEAIHARLMLLSECNSIPIKKLKYVYGHSHCNRQVGEAMSYNVAGQGMDGCTNYGFPVFDTTNGQFKVYHFLIQTAEEGSDKYSEIHDCISTHGVTQCYHLAEEWTVQSFEDMLK